MGLVLHKHGYDITEYFYKKSKRRVRERNLIEMGSSVNKAPNTPTSANKDNARKSTGEADENGTKLNDSDPGSKKWTDTSNARNLGNTDTEKDKKMILIRKCSDNDGTKSAAAGVGEIDEQREVTPASSFIPPVLRQKYVQTPYTKSANHNEILLNISRNENSTIPRPNERPSQSQKRNKRNSSINGTSILNALTKEKKNLKADSNIKASPNEIMSVDSIKQTSEDKHTFDRTVSDKKDNKTAKVSKLFKSPSARFKILNEISQGQSLNVNKDSPKQSLNHFHEHLLTEVSKANNDLGNPRDKAVRVEELMCQKTIKSPKPLISEANACSSNQMVKPGTLSAPSMIVTGIVDNTHTLTSSSQQQPDDIQASNIVTPQFNHEEEIYTSSSLRSSTLDSRLFTSETSHISYSDYSEVISTDTSSDTTINDRLKYALMGWYKSHGFNVHKFPLLPSSEMSYMTPWVTRRRHVESEDDLKELTAGCGEDKDNYIIEKRIRSFKHVFSENNERKIFLVGDHDTGKTLFLRYITKSWLDVHTKKEMERSQNVSVDTVLSVLDEETTTISSNNSSNFNELLSPFHVEQNQYKYFQTLRSNENSTLSLNDMDTIFEDSDELLKYEFLFYISLKHCKRHMNIREVIHTQYRELFKYAGLEDKQNEDILADILDNEPETCLILIDDLEEWRLTNRHYKAHIKSNGLPISDAHKMHTIVWTMTPLKFKQMSELVESDLNICIHGIDESMSTDLLERVVDDLNAKHQKTVNPRDIHNIISNTYLHKYERFPYTLQSLVRILYDFQFNNTCATFCQLLDLQFHNVPTWQEMMYRNKRKQKLHTNAWIRSEEANGVVLPNYFSNLEFCQINKHLLYITSKSAYSSWAQSFRCFDANSLETFGVSLEMLEQCIQAGIFVRDNTYTYKSMTLDCENEVRVTDRPVQLFLAASYISMLCMDEAYTNMGNIRDHSRKINAIVDDHIDITRDINKIFDNSEMIVFLSGLCPPLAYRLIKDIHEASNNVERIQQYRQTFLKDDRERLISDIQNLTFTCLHESVVTGMGIKEVFISDLYFNLDNMKYLKYVVPETVMSMHVSFARVENYDELSKFIFHGQQYSNLQKLIIRDETLKMTRADVDLVLGLLKNCAQSVCTFSCVLNRKNPETYLRLSENLHRQLLNMSHLQALELGEMTLRHDNFSSLSALISTKLRLRQLRLISLSCDVHKCDGEEHVMYLTEHADLEFLELDGREVTVADVNATSLRSCVIANMSPQTEFRIFDCLRRSKIIQSFAQYVRIKPSFVCKPLLSSMETWTGLQRLTLSGTNVAGNEIRVQNLPNLRRVNLLKVQMSAESWISFVDSLLLLPNRIQTYTTDLIIRPNETDLIWDGLNRPIPPETRAKILTGEIEKEKALDYVKKKKQELRVMLELLTIFNFETLDKG